MPKDAKETNVPTPTMGGIAGASVGTIAAGMGAAILTGGAAAPLVFVAAGVGGGVTGLVGDTIEKKIRGK